MTALRTLGCYSPDVGPAEEDDMTIKFPIDHLIDPVLAGRTLDEIAADLEVSTRTVQRWIASGVNWEQADTFAIKILNLHPLTAFGEAWRDASEAGHPAVSLEDDWTLDDRFDGL
jgi:hypothetical protein